MGAMDAVCKVIIQWLLNKIVYVFFRYLKQFYYRTNSVQIRKVVIWKKQFLAICCSGYMTLHVFHITWLFDIPDQ